VGTGERHLERLLRRVPWDLFWCGGEVAKEGIRHA